MKLRIGDAVIVNSGSYKGKTGTISKIYQNQGRVVVEGVNLKKRSVKAREGVPGQQVEFSAPFALSNVSVIDAQTGKGSRVGYTFEKDGTKVRITKASGKPVVKAAAKTEKPKKAEKAPKEESKATAKKPKTIKAE